MEDNEIQEGGISLGEIFRTIFSQKWLALIIAAVITVIGTVGIYFVTKAKEEYVISFSLNLPNASSTGSYYSYPDGNKFYYVDYISSDVLQGIKDSDKAFSDIDVEKMIKKGNISFTETFNAIESTADSSDSVVATRRVFDIRVAAETFLDEDVALGFMTKLVMYPINLYKDMNINYNVYLNKKDFDEALTYGTQINYLQSQIDYLTTNYGNLSNVTDDEGNLIASKRQQFNAWVSRIDLNALSTEASANYYLKDWETSIAKYRNQLVSLNDNLEDAETNLEEVKTFLSSDGMQSDDTASVISELQAKVTSLTRQITNINRYINAYYDANGNEKTAHIKKTEEFAAKIQAIYDEITAADGYIATYTDLSKDVYEKVATVSFMTPNIVGIDSETSFGLVKSFLVSFVAAVVVALVAAYIVGWYKNRKKQQKVETVSEIPVYVEAQAQAAVTNDEGEEDKDK